MTRKALSETGEGKVGLVVASVEIVMFSLDTDYVFVEGDIKRSRVFVEIVDYFELDRRKESR